MSTAPSPTPTHIVGANIRAEMARRNLPQSALAERLSISQAGVSNRLRGQTPFDVNELHAVADFLGVPRATLLDGVAAA